MTAIKDLLHGAGDILPSLDWILFIAVFIVSFLFARSAWSFWREETWKHGMDWIDFEIKVPREVLKGPKAMEQFFQTIYSLQNKPGSFLKKWWSGEVCRWYVIDLVGVNNELHIFFRLTSRLSEAVQGILYAQYPDIEIVETEDYLATKMWKSYDELSEAGYEIFGNELMQTESNAISINTYSEHESDQGDEKGRIIDPFAVLLELIHNLGKDEQILVQYIIQPDVHKHWVHGAEHMIEEIRNRTQEVGKDKSGNAMVKFRFRTPGEEDVIRRIEDKLEKGNFETTIRYMHLAPKATFNFNIGYRGIQTFFNQFRHDKQTLERNGKTMTKAEWYYYPWIFHNWRSRVYRRKFYAEYMRRFLPEESFVGKLYNSYFWRLCFGHRPMVLSAEELATLVHIPTNVVLTQATMERIESKRLPAPSGLPGT